MLMHDCHEGPTGAVHLPVAAGASTSRTPTLRRNDPMPTYSRREFLGLSAMIAAGAALRGTPLGALVPGPAAQAQQRAFDPDLIVINARVYTLDPGLPTAEAFAVKGDRFIAVGSTSDIRNLSTPR